MRMLLVLVSFLCTFGLSAAPVILVSPAFPRAGQPVTFTLAGVVTAGTVTWSFGDDSGGGGNPATHIYANARGYHVQANFATMAAAGVATTWITVAAPFSRGPNAPFSLASVLLRWKDGQSSLSVPRDSRSLVAYADIKFEGTGHFQAQWLVDGQVIKTVTQAMSFAGRTTIDSGTMPVFPTSIPGPHDVTLRIFNPAVNFRLPVIRYVVSLEDAQPLRPMVESVVPSAVHLGQETELLLSGQNLSADMKLDFGSGITLVAPIEVRSPLSARVMVFVPPTARIGVHGLAMVQGKDRMPSRATLEVKAP